MLGIGAHTAALSAHDARHCQRFLMIRNHEGSLAQGSLLTIEQYDPLIFGGFPHDNATLKCVEVKGMQGLTQLQHDVVGDIDDRINRPNTGSSKTLHHE